MELQGVNSVHRVHRSSWCCLDVVCCNIDVVYLHVERRAAIQHTRCDTVIIHYPLYSNIDSLYICCAYGMRTKMVRLSARDVPSNLEMNGICRPGSGYGKRWKANVYAPARKVKRAVISNNTQKGID
jgi:hypothetical protein